MELENTGFGSVLENIKWGIRKWLGNKLIAGTNKIEVEFKAEDRDRLLYYLEAFCCEKNTGNFLVNSYEKTGNSYLFRCPCDVIIDSGKCVSFPSGWKCRIPYGKKIFVSKCYAGSLEDLDLFMVCGGGLSLEYSETGNAWESVIVHLKNYTRNTLVVRQGTPLFVCEVV